MDDKKRTKDKTDVKTNGSDMQLDMEKKPVELLDRLKIVKVTSDDVQDDKTEGRPLPKERGSYELPLYGYEEPKSISEGKCTLRQALKFISNHQNDPSSNSVATIAQEHKMKAPDVENIITYFRAYEIYISRDSKVGVSKSALELLGVNKVIQPLFRSKFANVNKENKELEEKK